MPLNTMTIWDYLIVCCVSILVMAIHNQNNRRFK